MRTSIPEPSELRRICQRSKEGHGGTFYSDWTEYLPRQLSIYITGILLSSSVTPNQVTLVNLLLAVAAVFVLWPMRPWSYALYVFCLFIISILDCCDGEIARFKKLQSNSGLYLDISEATISRSLMFMALGFFHYMHHHVLWVLASGLLAANAYLLLKVLHYTKFRVAPGQVERMTGMPPKTRSIASLVKYGIELIVLKAPATYIVLLANALLLYAVQVDYIGWVLLGFTLIHTLAAIWLLVSAGILHGIDA